MSPQGAHGHGPGSREQISELDRFTRLLILKPFLLPQERGQREGVSLSKLSTIDGYGQVCPTVRPHQFIKNPQILLCNLYSLGPSVSRKARARITEMLANVPRLRRW